MCRCADAAFPGAAGDSLWIRGGPWHEESDLDLAVEGLSAGDLWAAERELEAIVPAWLEVDLVPLERVYPEMRARILGGGRMTEEPHLALKARLEEELVGMERIVAGLDKALERVGEEPDEFAVRALTSYIDDFYKSCERICERVAVSLEGVRDAVISEETTRDLGELMKFRHFRRYYFEFEYDWDKLDYLQKVFKRVAESLPPDLKKFREFLRELT